jgi:hypothetical protein
MFANNYISTIVENQLPEFIRADHPTFVLLLKKYYEYMEQTNKTLDVGKNLYDYMDVDTTRADLIKYFKSKIIPNFPEETELSTEKLIKAAKFFYSKKGSADSFKFIFRTLYGQEVEVYFPKEDILKASDGKWKLPKAIRLSFYDKSALIPGGNVNVFAVTANTINSNGINFVTKDVTVNSYIRIGDTRRKVVYVNTAGDYIKVDLPFPNVKDVDGAVVNQTFDSVRIYKVELSEYSNFNVKLLEKRRGIGEISRTTCVIEKAILTVDGETGREFVELYISNIFKLFDPGENLVVEYEDENGISRTFKSKIISLISNIKLYKNRFNVVQTGRKYFTGDPVVIYGGLNDSVDAVKAIAVVNNVSLGSIESITVAEPGYLFRDDPNSLVRVLSNTGVGANIQISGIWEDGANSETFEFNTDAIKYKTDIALNAKEYDFDNVTSFINLTAGVGNTTTAVNLNTATYTASTVTDWYKSFVLQIVDGTGAAGSPNSAVISAYNGTSKVATLATALAIAPDATSNVKIYANAQTEIGRAMTFESVLLGKVRFLDLEDGGSFFEEPPTFDAISMHDTDYSLDQGFLVIPKGQFSNYNREGTPPSIRLASDNAAYSLANGYYTGTRLFLDVGDTSHFSTVVDYIVTDPGSSANVKTVYLDRVFENNIDSTTILNKSLFFDFRPNVRGTGKIGTLLLKKGGTGYSVTDNVEFVGTGYGANAYLTVSSGVITGITLDNRGEGYPAVPSIIIKNGSAVSSGTGAEFQIYLLSDGESFAAETSDIGRIQNFRMINRGFDYANTPFVSLRVADILTDNLAAGKVIIEGDSVWQGGATNSGATFQAIVDGAFRADATNTVIRVFNYSGSLNTQLPIKVATQAGNLTLNVSTQNANISFNNTNEIKNRKYPVYYGDGSAKANAEFSNGLINYDGFYLNTDGFISADKKLQNKDYYHNFSYEIESETSLDDYKETVNRVAHPAGLQLLSRYLAKDILLTGNDTKSNLHSSNSAQTTNANTSFASNVFYGNSASLFSTTTAVGDIVIINTSTTAQNRKYSRLVTRVVNGTTLWLEEPIGGLGDGKIRTTAACNEIIVFSNSSAITESLIAGDDIRFNISSTIYDREVVSISGNTITLNTTVPAAANVLYNKIPSYNVVGFDIIKTNG